MDRTTMNTVAVFYFRNYCETKVEGNPSWIEQQ